MLLLDVAFTRDRRFHGLDGFVEQVLDYSTLKRL